jgi:hypothetical protein
LIGTTTKQNKTKAERKVVVGVVVHPNGNRVGTQEETRHSFPISPSIEEDSMTPYDSFHDPT